MGGLIKLFVLFGSTQKASWNPSLSLIHFRGSRAKNGEGGILFGSHQTEFFSARDENRIRLALGRRCELGSPLPWLFVSK